MVASLFTFNSNRMNKYLKFTGYLLAVLILFAILDYSIGVILDRYLFLKDDPQLEYAYKGGNGEDVVILGASRALHHYVPAVIENELNLSCYNYGMDGRNIFNQFVVASELIKDNRHKPSVAILEIASIDIEDTPGWNYEKLSNLNVLYKRNKIVQDLIDSDNPYKGFALRHSNLFRYNSLFLQLLKSVLLKNSTDADLKGYVPLHSVWDKDIETIENDSTLVVQPEKELYLRALLTSYQEAGIKLVVYNSPDYRNFKYPRLWLDKVSEICREFSVPFYNHDHDTLFMAHREWFNEPFHLNDDGAIVYTHVVSEEIDNYLNTN